MTRIKRGKRMNQVKPGRPIAKEQEWTLTFARSFLTAVQTRSWQCQFLRRVPAPRGFLFNAHQVFRRLSFMLKKST